ncbi:MAG TPA: UDP-2,4-diacetamido-2,4,6-trideoxy-beta-L-altropyranose hydrolase [Cyclobacteriaceae bacterium]|nr:UDP-2,4-diacetamido-2,4,6-trideoxy-beta-L-altropyranose hydrolase [Cyclobacteriaceae bacterium]
MTPIYLRADGNKMIGLGHVHRLLALAEMLAHNFDCYFAIAEPSDSLRELIGKYCKKIIDIPANDWHGLDEFASYLSGREIVVLDGYQFNLAYQSVIKAKGSRLVCIDDINAQAFSADVVINPSGGVNQRDYSLPEGCFFGSGPAWALLKSQFRIALPNEWESKRTGNCLICLGGADPNGVTLIALAECMKHEFISIHVVVGSAFQQWEKLTGLKESVDSNVILYRDVTPEELTEIMRNCGVAVCSSSGVAYEYLSVGGELYLIQTADNQASMNRFLISQGLAFSFSEMPVSREEVLKSRANQLSVFDGKIEERYIKLFKRLEFELRATLRLVGLEDEKLLFEWANDPEIRNQSYNQAPINWPTHQEWLRKKLADKNSYFYIIQTDGIPVGQVRLEIANQVAIVSYSIDKAFRGQGLGRSLLSMALKEFKKKMVHPILIVGYVKFSNEVSCRIFDSLGFKQTPTTDYPNSFRYEYVTHEDN